MTTTRLDSAGVLLREIVTEDEAVLASGWEGKVRRFIEQAGDPSPRPRKTKTLLSLRPGILAAVAAALLLVFLPRGGDQDSSGSSGGAGDPPVYLGGDPKLAPVLAASIPTEGALVFRWRYDAGPTWTGSCVVQVLSLAGEELAKSPPIAEPQEGDSWLWIPNDAETTRIRASTEIVLWRVTSRSPGGERVYSDFGEFVP